MCEILPAVNNLVTQYEKPETAPASDAWTGKFEREWYKGCRNLLKVLPASKPLAKLKDQLKDLLDQAKRLSRDERDQNREDVHDVLCSIRTALRKKKRP